MLLSIFLQFLFRKLSPKFICLVLFANTSFAQKASTDGSPGHWKLNTTVGGVKFLSQIALCSGEKVVLLKFNNQNNYRVKVTWDDLLQTSQSADKNESLIVRKEIVLPPGETAARSCDSSPCHQCFIVSSQVFPTHRVDISGFEYKNITVNKIL